MKKSMYQKLSHKEHILKRPDTYIGSTVEQNQETFVFTKNSIKLKQVSFIPGLYKIFDEILVNATDNVIRDKNTDEIRIEINRKANSFKIWNNGKSISIKKDNKHKILIPEMIFGHLITSSNFDDTQKRLTGGRNGLGAKLTNLFSKRFEIELGDSNTKSSCKIQWKDNMTHVSTDINNYGGSDYTSIYFEPDFTRFSCTRINNEMFELLTKRVYDVAGLFPSLKVYLNNKLIPSSGLTKYIKLFDDDLIEGQVSTHKHSKRWNIGLAVSKQGFRQVSFVNGVFTMKGGSHVDYIVNQITTRILDILERKYKKLNFKKAFIKNHLFVYVDCMIENPAFSSQIKESLTTRCKDFGSTCDVRDSMIRSFLERGLEDILVSYTQNKSQQIMKKKLSGKKTQKLFEVSKLTDAFYAGTNQSEKCTLIITEGDSAKALAISGLEMVKREYYGVYPLKGKLLNVRNESDDKTQQNKEITELIKILGLNLGQEYKDKKGLRYGKLLIMADQDIDGSHIKGLVINFIHYFWPSLLKINDFLYQFITPIVKVTDKANKEISFFSEGDYKNWMENNPNNTRKVKYYKGLGTSTSKEAREYFSNLNKHIIKFEYKSNQCDASIELAFHKARTDERKEWMTEKANTPYVDYNIKTLCYKDFIDQELVKFSIEDSKRAIPNLVDGLKPGQRKILFGCFKRNLKHEIKVAQLCGYVAEHSAYHHGEASLSGTIIRLAQNFVGANNINILEPIGQFGTRHLGGKDYASARYIHTNLSKLGRIIFDPLDDQILNKQIEDNMEIEPEFYTPVIPMVLVNGTEGIGTGWSTYLPKFNPMEIINNYKRVLKGDQFEELTPWFKSFKGTIKADVSKNSYNTYGSFERKSETTLLITELPIGKWIKNFSERLNHIIARSDLGLIDYKEQHKINEVFYELRFRDDTLSNLSDEDIIKELGLRTSMSMDNIVLFDRDGQIRKYTSIVQIMKEFYRVRYSFYQKRKVCQLSIMEQKIANLKTKTKFLNSMLNGLIDLRNTDEEEIRQLIVDYNIIEPDSSIKIDDLLKMPFISLTKQKVEQLNKELNKQEGIYSVFMNKSIEDIWLDDLNNLEAAYKEFLVNEKNDQNTVKVNVRPVIRRQNGYAKDDEDKKVFKELVNTEKKIVEGIKREAMEVRDKLECEILSYQLTNKKRRKLVISDSEEE